MSKFENFIGGAWVSGTDVATNINPSDTGDVVGEFARGTVADVDKAVTAAQAALPGWSASTPTTRHDALRKIGAEVLARSEALGRELSREQGKTLAEGIGEAVRAGQLFEFYAGEALRQEGLKMVLSR